MGPENKAVQQESVQLIEPHSLSNAERTVTVQRSAMGGVGQSPSHDAYGKDPPESESLPSMSNDEMIILLQTADLWRRRGGIVTGVASVAVLVMLCQRQRP